MATGDIPDLDEWNRCLQRGGQPQYYYVNVLPENAGPPSVQVNTISTVFFASGDDAYQIANNAWLAATAAYTAWQAADAAWQAGPQTTPEPAAPPAPGLEPQPPAGYFGNGSGWCGQGGNISIQHNCFRPFEQPAGAVTDDVPLLYRTCTSTLAGATDSDTGSFNPTLTPFGPDPPSNSLGATDRTLYTVEQAYIPASGDAPAVPGQAESSEDVLGSSIDKATLLSDAVGVLATMSGWTPVNPALFTLDLDTPTAAANVSWPTIGSLQYPPVPQTDPPSPNAWLPPDETLADYEVSANVNLSAVQYRLGLPAGYSGPYYKISWDEVFFPQAWLDWNPAQTLYASWQAAVAAHAAWEIADAAWQAADPATRGPEPVEPDVPTEPPNPGPEPTPPSLLNSRTTEWTGDGDGWSDWFVLAAPTAAGMTCLRNVGCISYRTPYGQKPTFYGQRWTHPSS